MKRLDSEEAKKIFDKLNDLHFQEITNRRFPEKNKKIKEELKKVRHELELLIRANERGKRK